MVPKTEESQVADILGISIQPLHTIWKVIWTCVELLPHLCPCHWVTSSKSRQYAPEPSGSLKRDPKFHPKILHKTWFYAYNTETKLYHHDSGKITLAKIWTMQFTTCFERWHNYWFCCVKSQGHYFKKWSQRNKFHSDTIGLHHLHLY
jgi:hypothetical protein